MAAEANTITPWIPVIATLVGAGIAFFASFVNAKFNKNKEEEFAKSNRNRERIERIYQLLVTINSEYANNLGETLNHIHNATPIKQNNAQELPPLIELEMIINLYFPDLESNRMELMETVQTFGKYYFEFRFKDYKREVLKKKQKDSGILVALQLKVNNQVKDMQKTIVKHVRA